MAQQDLATLSFVNDMAEWVEDREKIVAAAVDPATGFKGLDDVARGWDLAALTEKVKAQDPSLDDASVSSTAAHLLDTL